MHFRSVSVYILFIALGSVFFIPFLGGVHLFDWDEINFAEISREMIVTNDYFRVQVNFQPFWEKPPLFFWLQVISMKIFGINEFAARFPNAITGIISLMVIIRVGTRLFNQKFGFIWAMVYLGSILPHLYFKSGIIDPLFNLFIFSGLYQIILFSWKKEDCKEFTSSTSKYLNLIAGGIFIGLAILTKGPVAYLIVLLVMTVYWIWKRFRFYISIPNFIVLTLIAIIVTFAWLGPETLKNGPWLLKEFTKYQFRLLSTPDAGHAGFPGYHFLVLLLGCFPASVFAIRGFYKIKPEKDFQRDFRSWMIILFWVVLILFSIVQSKIVHYSSLAYFPLTFLAAITINRLIEGKLKFNRWLKFGIISIGLLYSLIAIIMPFLGRNIGVIKPLFKNDVFALANLEADVNWTGWESTAGFLLIAIIFICLLLINKEKIETGLKTLFFGTAAFLFIGLILFIGKIEMYSQNANIEFCKSLEGKDCYVITSGFKSYAQYFYTKKKHPENKKSYEIGWLTWEDVDKEVYIIAKIDLIDYWRSVYTVKEIGGKNGFMFYKRCSENHHTF